jgi:hypothetical protein
LIDKEMARQLTTGRADNPAAKADRDLASFRGLIDQNRVQRWARIRLRVPNSQRGPQQTWMVAANGLVRAAHGLT